MLDCFRSSSTGSIMDMSDKTAYAILIFFILEALLIRLQVTDGLVIPLIIRVLGSFWALPV